MRAREQERRRMVAEAQQAYDAFLTDVATPVTRQVAGALKAEGFPFTVSTPQSGLRLASDNGRDDYVEFALDTAGDTPAVMGRVRRTRGSRTIEDERPVGDGRPPAALTDQDVLMLLTGAIETLLQR
jgi:hypothetical protein